MIMLLLYEKHLMYLEECFWLIIHACTYQLRRLTIPWKELDFYQFYESLKSAKKNFKIHSEQQKVKETALIFMQCLTSDISIQ